MEDGFDILFKNVLFQCTTQGTQVVLQILVWCFAKICLTKMFGKNTKIYSSEHCLYVTHAMKKEYRFTMYIVVNNKGDTISRNSKCTV